MAVANHLVYLSLSIAFTVYVRQSLYSQGHRRRHLLLTAVAALALVLPVRGAHLAAYVPAGRTTRAISVPVVGLGTLRTDKNAMTATSAPDLG